MTLHPGDKLMSLTDVSEMLGIPIHTAQSATGWAAMCDTAERPLRLGWNSRSTNVGNSRRKNQSPSGPAALNRAPNQSGHGRDL